jgi:subtilase family serine protease
MSFARLVRAALPVVVLMVACGGLRGWSAQLAASRVAAIDGSSMVTLGGSVSPQVAAAGDLGVADASRQLPLMSLRFALTPTQQDALAQLVSDQQNPASPAYHRWFTPEQFEARFGLAPQDLATVSGWLTAQGLVVTSVARSGLFVQFSGTVGQVNRAFHTELHNVVVDGERHIANVTAASLPATIAAVTGAITGLDDFAPRAQVREQVLSRGAATGAAVGAMSQPEYTSATGSHYLAPGDFYTIYDENAAIQSGYTGFGITIAVVGQSDIYAADIAAFQSASGLPSKPPSVMLNGVDPGYTSGADLLEAELEVEWTGAVAPGANILYVNSADAINGSLTLAIDNDLAPIIADGYGECEASLGAAAVVYYNQMLQMAAAEGITIITAAGNDGATDCDTKDASATSGLAVDFPSSSPYVTAVGGTEFSENGGTYFAAANSAYAESALSYIPEQAWNDDGASGLAAGGGGASAYFSKPSWQMGAGVPADFSRDVPDVSLSASIAHDGYLVCTPGYCANGFQSASGTVDIAGGTAASAASFAGLMALVEQKIEGISPLKSSQNNSRIGVANPEIYALANSSYAGSVFHDVTSGTNASPCTAGSTGCGGGGSIGFAAMKGYDQATGWGSVDATNLVNDWGLATPLVTTGGTTASYTNVAASASPVSAGTAVTLTATVASAVSASTAVPTGSVQFTVDSMAVGGAAVLAGGSSAGTASYSLNTSSLSVGSHTVQATYLGDSNYAGSKGAFLLNVTAANPAGFTLTPSTATVTVGAGSIAPGVLFTLTAMPGFSGSVQFTATTPVAFAAQDSFSVNPVVLSSTATTGTTLLELLAYTNPAQPAHRVESVAAARPGSSSWRFAPGTALAGLLLLAIPRRRRKDFWLLALLACAGLGLALGLSGCGGGTPAPLATTGNVPTPPGTYVVTIAGTATANGVTTTRSSTVTFVVQ